MDSLTYTARCRIAQVKVCRCDLRHQGLHDGHLVLLGSQQVGTSSLGGAAQLPEIDLGGDSMLPQDWVGFDAGFVRLLPGRAAEQPGRVAAS